MPPDNCESCNEDPKANYRIPPYGTNIGGVITGGYSQFYPPPTSPPPSDPLDYKGNAWRRIALKEPDRSYTLHQGSVAVDGISYPYWYWVTGVSSVSPGSSDWVETREYTTSFTSPDDYPGTISKIHLSYGPNYPSDSQGVEYKYSYGVVKSKQFLGIGYKEAEREIDKYTGMIKSEWDANNVGAGYSYDNLLRLTTITPTHSEAAEYIFYPPDDVKRIEYGRGYDPSTSGIPTLATHKIFHFDGLGRLIKSKELMPDDTYSVVEKAYDPNGRELFVSEPYKSDDTTVNHNGQLNYPVTGPTYSLTLLPTKGTCLYGTVSTVYPDGLCGGYFNGTPDPLGRVRRVIKPDGSYTDTTYDGFDYTVTLHGIEGTGDSSSTYQMDAFGRLIHVDAPIVGTDADYFYDSQDRLINVDLGGQIRTFTYDNLGFLTSSYNPENGLVTIDNPSDPNDG